MKKRNFAVTLACLIFGVLAYLTSPYSVFNPPLGSASLTANYPFELVYNNPTTHQNVTFGNMFVNVTGDGGVAALSQLTMRVEAIINASDINVTAMYFEPLNAYQLSDGALVPSSFGPPKFANISMTNVNGKYGVSETHPPHTYFYWSGSTTLQYQTDGSYGGTLVITKFSGVNLAAPIVAQMPAGSIHVSSEEEGVVARQNELTTSITFVVLFFAALELRDEDGKKRR